jgi:hypothetical protein
MQQLHPGDGQPAISVITVNKETAYEQQLLN